MQTIQDVEKAISLNKELLSETKKRITDTAAKLSTAKEGTKRIATEITALKEKRQQALARGGDSKGLNDALKKLESELELESETATGLEKFQAELREEESTLHLTIDTLPKKIMQIRSLELAASYNSLAEKMAPVIEELNEIYYRLSGNGNNKENLVAFYPMEGPFEKLPCIFYDDAGLSLEAYVAKNPGKYHSNSHLSAGEKSFYDWALHQNKLRS